MFESDINKAAFAEKLPLADPTDYVIRIFWHDVSVIDANGKFVSGWLAGNWIAPEPPPSKGNLDDYLK